MSNRSHQELADLEPGETGIVAGISPKCAPDERRRLMELGFFPGTEVRAMLASPLGDPVAYRLREMTIALRRRQAELIEIRHG